MDQALRITLAVFVLSTGVSSTTETPPTETVTYHVTEELAVADRAADAVSSHGQTVTVTGNSGSWTETTIMSTTENGLTMAPETTAYDLTTAQDTTAYRTTFLSTTVNELTTSLGTTLYDLTATQSDVSTTSINDDEAVTTLKINDDILTTRNDSEERSVNNMTTWKEEVEVIPSTGVTDNIITTFTYDDDNYDYTRTALPDKTSRIAAGDVGDKNMSRCSFVINDTAGALYLKLELRNSFRNQVEKWHDLKARNETDRVNTVVFAQPIEATEWFVVYDQRFREAFSEIIANSFNKVMDANESSTANCTFFTPADLVYVSPSPFRQGDSTVVSFTVCDPFGYFCLAFQRFVALEKQLLEENLNLTILTFDGGSHWMDAYNTCRCLEHDADRQGAPLQQYLWVLAAGGVLGLVLSLVVRCCRRSASYRPGKAAYMSNRFTKHCPGSGHNLASDQQCQLEEIVDSQPPLRNQPTPRPGSSSERRKALVSLENDAAKPNTDMEEKL